ncbi:hypothetical protein SAMN05421684_0582 [Asanoa ishikariensis]|uniref:Uncharacterized protein n=1 Tax=Asanoa ishikariensis TaxID=137265 RepID=A0A1H3L8L1_9ACTN|nr:hypothetical protein SAMN05421684_0582 [Asanoa ishikariensis]
MDWCYFVDPGLDVTRADRVEIGEDGIGGFAVVVTLTPADGVDYAAWTTGSAGHQIAISVEGRVLIAPDLLEPLSGDALHIIGLTETDAQTLLRQLWE